jgi:hypothetical protein
MTKRFWIIALLAAATAALANGDAALVTAVEGGVTRVAPGSPLPVQAFVKLKHGDLLTLDKAARVQVVYFDNGRQETWTGGGRLEITKAGGVANGLADPQVKTLPPLMVKQIAKTPSLDSQGRAGMMRLRAVPGVQDPLKVEENYKRMRQEAAADDLNPELYILSSMLEMRQFERVEQVLADLRKTRSGNRDAAALVALYEKALHSAREKGAAPQ